MNPASLCLPTIFQVTTTAIDVLRTFAQLHAGSHREELGAFSESHTNMRVSDRAPLPPGSTPQFPSASSRAVADTLTKQGNHSSVDINHHANFKRAVRQSILVRLGESLICSAVLPAAAQLSVVPSTVP